MDKPRIRKTWSISIVRFYSFSAPFSTPPLAPSFAGERGGVLGCCQSTIKSEVAHSGNLYQRELWRSFRTRVWFARPSPQSIWIRSNQPWGVKKQTCTWKSNLDDRDNFRNVFDEFTVCIVEILEVFQRNSSFHFTRSVMNLLLMENTIDLLAIRAWLCSGVTSNHTIIFGLRIKLDLEMRNEMKKWHQEEIHIIEKINISAIISFVEMTRFHQHLRSGGRTLTDTLAYLGKNGIFVNRSILDSAATLPNNLLVLAEALVQ